MNPENVRRALAITIGACIGLLLGALFVAHPEAQPNAGTGTAYNRCLAVTTSDTADLPPFTQSQLLTSLVYVGGAGNVTAVLQDGSTILFTAPPVGAQLPIAVRRINATATTATALVACYKV